MRVEVKVCGLTRPEDARAASELGARYVGTIFAGGPRNLEPARARLVLDGAGAGVDRVGVFGATDVATITRTVREAKLDIVQLHADPTPAAVRAIRESTGARVWAVVRVEGALATDALRELWEAADALLLDSKSPGTLGGTGTSFDWSASESAVRLRAGTLVVAGGLSASNVGEAIDALSPDIVDVSSGVESAPGIKDHARIADFIEAVRRTGVLR